MCASGLAGVLMPDDVGKALELVPETPRGRTEVRAGLGGTYAALGAWSLLSRSPVAKRAVGVTWLGAGLARLGSLSTDRPRTDAAFWAYLAVELGLGSAAIGAHGETKRG
jgi:Domain of unknown function (DUF4345)